MEHSLRKFLLVLLPIVALIVLFGLILGSSIAEGPTNTGFTAYMFVMMAILITEFVMLWKQIGTKFVAIISSLTLLFLFADFFSDVFFIEIFYHF